MIESFLNHFYKVISFEKGEEFKAEEFHQMFLEKASLLEENEQQYERQTVAQYIKQFQNIYEAYPELFLEGFHEQQISYEVIETENSYLVASRYEKRYTRDGEPIIEYGTNNFILVLVEEKLKIASVLW